MVGGMKVGDPADPATEIGPLVAERQQERVERLHRRSARRRAPGSSSAARSSADGLDKGWYVAARRVFADVDNDMRIAQEEIFGPVLVGHPLRRRGATRSRIANDSDYGLAGSVWTADIDRGLDIARRVRTGTYGINQYIDGLRRAVRRLQGSAASAASSAPRASTQYLELQVDRAAAGLTADGHRAAPRPVVSPLVAWVTAGDEWVAVEDVDRDPVFAALGARPACRSRGVGRPRGRLGALRPGVAAGAVGLHRAHPGVPCVARPRRCPRRRS